MNPHSPGRASRAYTLTELLVVISIIALLGGLSVGAFQAARRTYELKSAKAEIQALLRAARNTAILTRTPSFVIIDPPGRTIEARSFQTLGEWSFDASDDDEKDGGPGLSRDRGSRGAGGSRDRASPGSSDSGGEGGEAVGDEEGKVGRGIDFRSSRKYLDCGNKESFRVRRGLVIEAWVRHYNADPVPEPAARRKKKVSSRRRRVDADPLYTIVGKGDAYFLGMTKSGALEAAIGDYRARTREGVVSPERWVLVTLRYDGGKLSVSADGVQRELKPLAGGFRVRTTEGGVTLPATIPQSSEPLTISSADAPFPGEIDEVRVRGEVEPRGYTCEEHFRILGWKKIVHFDRHGRLDPLYHEEPVRIVLVEVPDEEPSGRTEVIIDYSLTYEEWLKKNEARFSKDEKESLLTQREQEAQIEQSYFRNANVRYEVIEVDRLGVVR